MNNILNQFEVVLLDMGETFMFGCDRFNNVDEIRSYSKEKNLNFDIDKISRYIDHIYNGMLQIGRDEKYFDNLIKVGEFINKDKILRNLSENEKVYLEDLFAYLEIGHIPEKYRNIIRDLSKRHRLGLISNVWSDSKYFTDYLKSIEIINYFELIIFSSDYSIIKPSKKLFELAFQYFKKEIKDYVYIGNSYKRDVIGSKSSGIYSILINNGKQSEINDKILPDYIINDIEEIV